MSTEENDSVLEKSRVKYAHVRNLVAFWFFGLCNNFPYVVMLSAANDILADQEHLNKTRNLEQNVTEDWISRDCNQVSTGAVLLADILPTLLLKFTAPFFMQSSPYGVRVGLIIVAQCLSYVLVSFSVAVGMSLFGVVCASLASGLGEITLLSLASHFDKNVVSTWSSGTGGAGIFGALAYAGLISVGLSPRTTVLIMLVIPAIMLVCYWFLLVTPKTVIPSRAFMRSYSTDSSTECIEKAESFRVAQTHSAKLTVSQKLILCLPLLKYMLPLMFVYMFEYFINQGLHELMYFHNIWLKHGDQYRWYQVIYQLGVFISRSSVNLFRIPTKALVILPLLQLVNLVIFFCEAYMTFVPNIWIIFALILFEGLLGGGSYVNTFYHIRQDIAQEHLEFSLGVATAADSLGIVIAAFSSMPVHNWICAQPLRAKHY